MGGRFEPWRVTLQLYLEELPADSLRVTCVLPDLAGGEPVEFGPVELDAPETAKFISLWEETMAVLRETLRRQQNHIVPTDKPEPLNAADPSECDGEEVERIPPAQTDPRALRRPRTRE